MDPTGTSTASAATAGSSRPPATAAAAPRAGSTRTPATSSGTATRHSKRPGCGGRCKLPLGLRMGLGDFDLVLPQ